jgi:multiple sugar transport system permease protein
MQNLLYLIRGRTVRQQRARVGYLFILPSLLFVVALFVFPAIYNLILSFSEWSLTRPMSFVGLANFESVLTSDRFWNSLRVTLYFSVISVPVTIILAVAVALAFHRIGKLIGTSVARALYFMPVIASLTAVAYIWMWIFNPAYGMANTLLHALRLPELQWLGSQRQVIPALSIMYIWSRLGFNMLILLAGLNSIPPDYYEAAAIDGASGRQAFWSITLPLLNRQLVLVSIVEGMTALKTFALPYAATGGGPVEASRTWVMTIFDLAFHWNRMGESAVMSTLLFLFILVLTLAQQKLFTRKVDY